MTQLRYIIRDLRRAQYSVFWVQLCALQGKITSLAWEIDTPFRNCASSLKDLYVYVERKRRRRLNDQRRHRLRNNL